MNRFNGAEENGFTLLEIMVVLCIIGALLSIALPHYAAYRQQSMAVACLANRHQAERDESAYNLEKGSPGLAIDERYRCPAGGELVWIISDPAQPGYPRLGCSLHYFPVDAGEPAVDALFSSTFDDMEGLTPLMGTWAVESGALVTQSNGERRLAFGEDDWTDYTIQVNATLTGGSGYGLYYRSDGKADISGYVFQYDPGYGRGEFIVRKVENGREQSPIQRVAIPDGFSTFNTSHQISVSVEGARQTIKVDGETILSFSDDTYSSGMGGLRTWSNSQVMFEDVAVVPADSGGG